MKPQEAASKRAGGRGQAFVVIARLDPDDDHPSSGPILIRAARITPGGGDLV